MNLKGYLALMIVGTALAWSAVVFVITNTNPLQSSNSIFAILYTSVFLALAGTLSLLGLAIRVGVVRRHDTPSRQAAIAFRQGILLAGMCTIGLFLESRSLLVWWAALLLVAGMTLLEFALISAKMR